MGRLDAKQANTDPLCHALRAERPCASSCYRPYIGCISDDPRYRAPSPAEPLSEFERRERSTPALSARAIRRALGRDPEKPKPHKIALAMRRRCAPDRAQRRVTIGRHGAYSDTAPAWQLGCLLCAEAWCTGLTMSDKYRPVYCELHGMPTVYLYGTGSAAWWCDHGEWVPA